MYIDLVLYKWKSQGTGGLESQDPKFEQSEEKKTSNVNMSINGMNHHFNAQIQTCTSGVLFGQVLLT